MWARNPQNHATKNHTSLKIMRLTPHLSPSRTSAPCQPSQPSRLMSRHHAPMTPRAQNPTSLTRPSPLSNPSNAVALVHAANPSTNGQRDG